MATELTVNGRTYSVEAEADTPLLYVLRNDLGLLAEEYDPRNRRLLGNFPQAFTHVALVNTARNLSRCGETAADRGRADTASTSVRAD